ncbi:MAG: helix-turn-helix domain-containing protein [Chitinophagaceae bacterium]
MRYLEIEPSHKLKQYVKCFYLFESDSNASFEDKAFATGCVEIMFNLGTGSWQTEVNSEFITTPSVELWGQIIQPLKFRSIGKNTMFGIRFYPHTTSCFLGEHMEQFNNRVSSLSDVMNQATAQLHMQLLEASDLKKRIEIVETFLWQQLSRSLKTSSRVQLIGNIIEEIKKEDFFDNIENLSSRYGITSRYLQKLFLQYTGLTPKLFSKINRFQNSLLLVSKQNTSLTSIAYATGYFDQSHFIREFKSFTGDTPSGYNPENSSAVLASANK